jgi:hypothetical protein
VAVARDGLDERRHWRTQLALERSATIAELGAQQRQGEVGPRGPSFNRDIKNFILVGLGLPEPGCWEVTAEYKGAELSYVLFVED